MNIGIVQVYLKQWWKTEHVPVQSLL
jgi:hypothetical protein